MSRSSQKKYGLFILSVGTLFVCLGSVLWYLTPERNPDLAWDAFSLTLPMYLIIVGSIIGFGSFFLKPIADAIAKIRGKD